MAKRRKNRRLLSKDQSRRLHSETLEKRELLAFDLIGVNPNAQEIFQEAEINELTESPSQLTFRFDGGADIDPATLGGIRITRAGGDRSFVDGNEELITPGFVGFGDSQQTVLMRFAEPLEDDLYRIDVHGADDTNQGIVALRNLAGAPFVASDGTTTETILFDLELGAQVIGVVPQPMDRVAGDLQQAEDSIDVYFDNLDVLGSATLTDPRFYQLIGTQDTVSNNDDVVVAPVAVSAFAEGDVVRVRLDFAAGDITGLAAASIRLRVGTDAAIASAINTQAPVVVGPSTDPGSTIAAGSAEDLGVFNADTHLLIQESIRVTAGDQLRPDYLGAHDEPGERDIDNGGNRHVNVGVDASPNITTTQYNFSLGISYGNDAFGNPLFTSINPTQMQRTREVFEFYGSLLGIDFVETESSGLAIVVGDLFPSGFESGPGGVAGVGGGGGVIMDAAENWNDRFGGSFFDVMLHEVGHAIGLGHTYNLPDGTIQGSVPAGRNFGDPNDLTSVIPQTGYNQFVFPGDQDIIHGQHIHRPDNMDVDLYRFEVQSGQAGEVTVETIAERLRDSSNLDSRITLFKQGPDGLVQVAANDDYFSQDSLIRVRVDEGVYFIGVSASAEINYDPTVDASGSGGRSQGDYELRVDFKADGGSALVDENDTPIDGDGDGVAGGVYNFWFNANTAANTVYVDKLSDAVTPTGAIDAPFREIDDALAAVAASGGAIDMIRVVGNGGVDGDVNTLADNDAYQIGRVAATNTTLVDGVRLEVPAGVTLSIDEGAILKFNDSAILVGSDGVSTSRAGGVIQSLGTPDSPVVFTSYSDPVRGAQVNPIDTVPGAGDWGGIEIRNDVDRGLGRPDLEREGIFLNYISNSEIHFGGGVVPTTAGNRSIDPIQLSEARPELTHNEIQNSLGAAISADPNSFEETTFNEARYQFIDTFIPDYDRVGPEFLGNRLTNNSINALQVRIDSNALGQLNELEVAGRFDDTDIVHSFVESLVVSGTPGGAFLEQSALAPQSLLINGATASVADGTLSPGDTVAYAVTFVDSQRGESLPSDISATFTIGAGGNAFALVGLPSVERDFVARRLYRSTNGGALEFVAELDSTTPTFTDNGSSTGVPLPFRDAIGLARERARTEGSLIVDPGVIIKSADSRFQLEMGATMIAEGRPGKPVIFTSSSDDRYGTGGTYDTNNNGPSSGAAGDWGGIFGSAFARVSLDNAVFAYGGGNSTTTGEFVSTNAIELHQAEARITNTLFENNDAGATGNGNDTRQDLGTNAPAVIYVAGAQPFIVDNTFVNNNAAVISINANALNDVQRQDFGRQTGTSEIIESAPGNSGPIVEGNELSGNAINGMVVRPQTLTTQSIFDDTSIVHVVENNATILVPDFSHKGGLRLESSESESLVVKFGSNASIEATGLPLDIDDRIGGRIQVVGTPGFPVILTGLGDDSVGAGFGPDGLPAVDTANDGPTTGNSGSWTGLVFDEFSHDRNVGVAIEAEGEIGGFGDSNSIPATAQLLGTLAASEKAGDENSRLGFEVQGTISAPSDLDVYRFDATGGTLVWIDIDRTDLALDSVVELIDAAGNVLAASDDSLAENDAGTLPASTLPAGHAMPMQRSPLAARNADGSYRDLYSINPNDAGMRVVLQGPPTQISTYYVRVRSSNDDITDMSAVRDGQSQGGYELHLRLRETDEISGSTVRYADIRYAQTGIQTFGLPAHSLLEGEGALGTGTDIDLGNLGNSDRAAVSAAGQITESLDETRYNFQVIRDGVQVIGDFPLEHYGITIDADFSDGLARPNLNFYLYYSDTDNADAYRLVAFGAESNIADDQVDPNDPTNTTDLDRGSFGTLDAFLGSKELPAGFYSLVVSSSRQVSQDLAEFFGADGDTFVRVEPIEASARIGTDRFDFDFDPTDTPVISDESVGFATPPVFGTAADAAVEFSLGDIPLFLVGNQGADNSRLVASNPFRGGADAIFQSGDFTRVGALTVHPQTGVLYGVQTGTNDANSDALVTFTTGSDSANVLAGTGLQTFDRGVDNQGNPITTRLNNGNGFGMQFEALSFSTAANNTRLYGVAGRSATDTWTGAVIADFDGNGSLDIGPAVPNLVAYNYVYQLDIGTGGVLQPNGAGAAQGGNEPIRANVNGPGSNNASEPADGTQFTPHAFVPSTSRVTGMAQIDSVLYAVDASGGLFRVGAPASNGNLPARATAVGVGGGTVTFATHPTLMLSSTESLVHPTSGHQVLDDNGVAIQFTDLTSGLLNLSGASPEGVPYDQILFGTDQANRLHAFDVDGNPQHIFIGGRSTIDLNIGASGAGAVNGLALANLDTNLWHVTDRRENDPGHGIDPSFDGFRLTGENGGDSLYFGFEAASGDHNQNDGGYQTASQRPDNDGDFGLNAGAKGALDSQIIDLSDYERGDRPMLYFNYLSTLNNTGGAINPGTNGGVTDSLRVYVAGDDGEWTLIATNNDVGADSNSVDDFNDEYDILLGGLGADFVDEANRYQFVEHLSDTGDWRQARISLSPWAGQSNVQIRVEYDSAGETLPYQAHLFATSPDRLTDGDLVTLQTITTGQAGALEVEFGALLAASSGVTINDGATIALNAGFGTTTFTFSRTPAGPNTILIADGMNSAQVAAAMRFAFQAAGFVVESDAGRAALVNVPAATITSTSGIPANMVIGNRIVSATTKIEVDINDTVTQVRDAIRLAMANEFNIAGQETNISVYPSAGESSIALYDFEFGDTGPFTVFGGQDTGISTRGEGFGIYGNGWNNSEAELRSNRFRFQYSTQAEGIYIDDVIIGLAERGELVLNAGTTNRNLQTHNRFGYTSPLGEVTEREFGEYQIEVRVSRDYGLSDDETFPEQLFDPFRPSLDSNDRLAQGFGVEVGNAAFISDGDTFTLSNGIDQITFEFNDIDGVGNSVAPGNVPIPFSGRMTDVKLAESVLAAFNFPSVSNTLGVTAATVSGETISSSSPTGPEAIDSNRLIFFGPVSTDRMGGFNFGMPGILNEVVYGGDTADGPDDGDVNRRREQGQFIVEQTIVRDSSNFGIVIDAGRSDRSDRSPRASTELARSGAVINLPTPNEDDLVPGAVLRGNVLAGNGAGGISISGQAGAVPVASVPFVRVVNNTIFGGQTGIDVQDSANPTLLNNIVSETNTGINVDVSSRSGTVIGATFFHDNVNDVGTGVPIGTFVEIGDGSPAFVDPSEFNFYLEDGIAAIDSSVTFLGERTDFGTVKVAAGIGLSPIITAPTDLFGAEHDQNVNTTPGQVVNVFVDRGAIDRSDIVGPQATILNPLDNDIDGLDLDPEITFIQLQRGTLDSFEILVSENIGTGPDAQTVTADQVSITESGRLLEEGIDYVFGYNASSRTIRLTPLSGIWRPDAVYLVSLNNRDRLAIETAPGPDIRDGDQIRLVDENGTESVFEFEAGNAIRVPTSLSLRITDADNRFVDGETFTITAPDGTTRTFEINLSGSVSSGRIPVDLRNAGTIVGVRDAIFDAIDSASITSALDLAPRRVGDDVIQIGSLAGHSVTDNAVGLEVFGTAAGIEDGQQFSYDDGLNTTIFEFDSNSAVGLGTAIPFERTSTPGEIANAIAEAARANLGLPTARNVDDVVLIGGAATDVIDLLDSTLTIEGSVSVEASLSITVPDGATPASLEANRFEVTVGNVTESFTFSTDPTLPVSGRLVVLDANSDTADIAARIATEVGIAFAGDLNPVSDGSTVLLGEQPAIIPPGTQQVRSSISPVTSGLVVDGISGGAIPVTFLPSPTFTAAASAAGLIAAINLSPLELSPISGGGGTVLLDGAFEAQSIRNDVAQDIGVPIEAIKDLAGNPLQSNRANGETRFTIVMPDVELDFGDAPDQYSTLTASNGPRHAISSDALPRLGRFIDSEANGQPVGNDDIPAVFTVEGNEGVAGDGPFTIVTDPSGSIVTLNVLPNAGDNLAIEFADGSRTVFEFVVAGSNASLGRIPVPFDLSVDTIEDIASRLSDAVSQGVTENNGPVLAEYQDGTSSFSLIPRDDEDGVPVGRFVGTAITEGLFLDDSIHGSTVDPGQVVAFLNRNDPAGAVIPITVTGAGLLDAWIDFNGDGDFLDLDEHVFAGVPVSDGLNPLRVTTPATATVGSTWARFRISSEGSGTFAGIANNGEVEDYAVTIFDIVQPVPDDDTYTVAEDNVLTVDGGVHPSLFANDVLPTEEFVESQYTIAGELIPHPTDVIYRTEHGQVRVDDAALGHFTYTPDPDYYGPDSFRYSVSTQRNSGSEVDQFLQFADVNITVTPVNDAPGVSDAFLRTIEDIQEENVIDNGFRIDASVLLADATSHGNPMIGPPQDESDQEIFLQSITTVVGGVTRTLDVGNPASIPTVRGGVLSATFDTDGNIASVLYQPSQDFNSENLPPTLGQFLDDEFIFTVVDDGISVPIPPALPTPPDPQTASATAFIRVTPQNDPPALDTDDVSVTDPNGAYTQFHVIRGIPVVTPMEDESLTIRAAFLLENDEEGPVLAADERSRFNGNDGALRIIAASVLDPSHGTISVNPITGDLTFVPADDIYGEVFFSYTAIDSGIDQAAELDVLGNPAPKLPAPLTSTVISRIFLEPINDLPVAVDRAFNVVEAVEQPAGSVVPAQIRLLQDDLLLGTPADLLNPTLDASASDVTLAAPYDESIQTPDLRITSITAEGITRTTTGTLILASGGELAVTFDSNGFFTEAVYTPPVDYNSTAPFFVPEDTFTYTVTDNGVHEFPVGNVLTPDTLPATSVPATVSLTVTPANDLPVFDVQVESDVLERDDFQSSRIDNFITNVSGGPGTALDEDALQNVFFSISELSVPAGLMVRRPIITGTSIEVFPAPDQFGQATYVITGTDNGVPAQSVSQTVTINVRPVNDVPRIELPAVLSDASDTDPDLAYSVAPTGEITYTLREDNTQFGGDTSQRFFIPLNGGPQTGSYEQVGLLDVFTVGPANEAAAVPGGSQVLELLSFGNASVGNNTEFSTDLGGRLRAVFSGQTVIGLEYRPPVDFNSDFGGVDSFTYEVRDDSTTGGETWSLAADALIPDRLTATNRVSLRLNPVNDAPIFQVSTTFLEVPEDNSVSVVPNYAFNINAGPPISAFDEVHVSTGQSVNFVVNPLSFPAGQLSDFFEVAPSINRDTGELVFQAAPDVFGEFDFELILQDNGLGDHAGANQRGDINGSIPVTLTIDVQPTNDPPVVDPTAAPLHFTLLEDGSVDILVTGDNTSPGLLDVFLVGPDNEAADIAPEIGGNQSVSLGQPIPATSADGGTIEVERDQGTGQITRLIYFPREDFVGMDSFIYTVTDDGQSVRVGTGGVAEDDPRIASHTVTFDVLPVNDAPQFSGAGNVTSAEDDGEVSIENWATNVQAGPVTAVDEINGLGNVPPQGLQFEFEQISSNTDLFVTPPRAVINGNSATLVYETAPDANGVATFRVVLIDTGPDANQIGDENESMEATFVINVDAVNDAPEFTAGENVFISEDNGPYAEIWATDISPGPDDESSQTVGFVVTTPAEFQHIFRDLPLITPEGLLRFTPEQNQNTDNPTGPAEIAVTAIDSEGGQTDPVTLTISISEINDPPVPVSDSFDTDEDSVLTITSAELLANDIDPDLVTNPFENLTVLIDNNELFSVNGARVTLDPATGDITYDPTNAVEIQAQGPGDTAADSFSYKVRDAAGVVSGLVTVGLNVSGINDAPIVANDEVGLVPDDVTVIRPLDNDVDVDGMILPGSIDITLQPAFGAIDIQPDGTLIYRPFVSFSEVDQFRYTVRDDLQAVSQQALVTISANSSPIAADDARGTFLEEPVDIDVAANDIDPDGALDLDSIQIVNPPQRGEAIPQAGGIVQYVPEPGFVGRDSFTYRIFDQEGRPSNIATVDTQVVASRLQNPDLNHDVNDDGFVTALDALLIINHLGRNDAIEIPVMPEDRGPNFYDVNGSLSITALDANNVINEIARRNALDTFAPEQVAPQATGTDLASSTVDPGSSLAEADALKVIDASEVESVAAEVVDLIANGRESGGSDTGSSDAIDAAMADLL